MTSECGLRVEVLRTARLSLTTWRTTDAKELQALHSDPLVMAYMASGVQTVEQTSTRIAAWRAEHAARGWSKWRVADHTGVLIGRAGFGTAHDTGHRELGYLLAAQRWGRGYGTELVGALVAWHREHGDADGLRAYVDARNAVSRHLLEVSGFAELDVDGCEPPHLVYALV